MIFSDVRATPLQRIRDYLYSTQISPLLTCPCFRRISSEYGPYPIYIYPHFDELKSGLATAKSIMAKINERFRRARETIAVEQLSASITGLDAL